MRTKVLFNNVNASQAHTSEILDFQSQDAGFLIQALKTGTNGNPRLIVEEAISTIWTALENTQTWEDYSEIGETVAIKDNYFMGKLLRVRLEPNGTTTGTITVEIGYKTRSY